MSRPQFGLVFGAADSRLVEGARQAERLGYDSFWSGEHVACWSPTVAVIPALSAVAAVTRQMIIGSCALLLPVRHPTIVAKELAFLDVLSEGRLAVGIGIGGENPAEFAACGVAIRERGGRADEMIKIMRLLWREETATFHGRYFDLDGVRIAPKPVQCGGPPLLVAGRSEAAMRRAATLGDGYLPYLVTPEQYAKAMRRVRDIAEQAGRDLAEFHDCLLLFVSVDETRDESRRIAAGALSSHYGQDFSGIVDRFCLLGPPDDCVERLREFVEAGAQHIVLAPLPMSVDRIGEQMVIIAERVLPGLREPSSA